VTAATGPVEPGDDALDAWVAWEQPAGATLPPSPENELVFHFADVEPRPAAPTIVTVRPARIWPIEVAVGVLALILNAWQLDRNGYGNSYYAASVRSMTQNWKAFFYGSLDPGNWITVDKPPAARWFQALSARIFGFSSWSLLLPGAVAGALAVYLLIVTVRRVWGRAAGLAAGLVLALTPVAVAASRSNSPDATLMLAAVGAAFLAERAITTGRARWMILAGAVCGFGFLTKLLVVGLVMPGLWLGYLVAARAPFWRRCTHLVAAFAAFVAVSLCWVAVADLSPTNARPFIGGSTDNTALDLAIGYRGIGRVTGSDYTSNGPGGNQSGPPVGVGGPGGNQSGSPVGVGGPGGTQSGPPGGLGGPGGPGALGGRGGLRPGTTGGSGTFVVDEFGGSTGVTRMFNNGMGDQVTWLAPLVGMAALGGLVHALRRRRRDARLGSLLLFVGWIGVTGVIFSWITGVFHNYYVALLAPAAAALVGIGVALFRDAGRLGRLATAGALALTAAWQVRLIQRIGRYDWMTKAISIAIGVLAVLLVVSMIRRHLGRQLVVSLTALMGVVVLAAPAVWSWSGTQIAQQGTFPAARPAVAGQSNLGDPSGFGQTGGPGAGPANGPGGATVPGGFGPPGGFPGQTNLTAELLTWLRSQRTTERWLVAVQSSMQADIALVAGDSVMAIGGFSGSDDSMSKDRFADLVETDQLRFVMADGGFGGGFPGGFPAGFGGPGPGPAATPRSPVTPEVTYVRPTSPGTQAPASGGTGQPPVPAGGPPQGGSGSNIAAIATQACQLVPAATWGGTATTTLYDCLGRGARIRSYQGA
jgi:4-amino-4-deoxy-L-arabinose transferase-like glycosyltransferase